MFIQLKDLINCSLMYNFDLIFDTGTTNEIMVCEALLIENLYDIFQWLTDFLHAQSELLLDFIKPIENLG